MSFFALREFTSSHGDKHIPTEIMRHKKANSSKIKMSVFYSSESDQHELEGVGRGYWEGLFKLDVDNRVAVS